MSLSNFGLGQYGAVDREACWAALFALLKAKIGAQFVTMSRQHLQPPSLSAEQQPALFVVQARESRKPTPPGTPVQLMLDGFLIVYLQVPAPGDQVVGEETELAATDLNELLAAIDTALMPDSPMEGLLTLGGLVRHCWIEGDVELDPGIYSAQAAAIVPVKMLVP